MTLRFEWDENKNRANILKHRVGFDEASKVFSDPHVIIRETALPRERNVCTSSARLVERVLPVVHTFREEGLGAIVRIISARKATPAERKLYEENE